MFLIMWPTLGGELSVVASEAVRKNWTKNDQELGPNQENFDKIHIL